MSRLGGSAAELGGSAARRLGYRVGLVGLVAVAAGPAEAAGQAEASPRERLAFFQGTWTDSARPGYRETCDWLAPGRRVLACRATWPAGDRRFEALGIYSYDRRDSTYTYYGAFPNGTFHLVGHPDGDGWRFEPIGPVGGRALRVRYHITPVEGGVRYVEEASEGEGLWRVTEDYTLRRDRHSAGP